MILQTLIAKCIVAAKMISEKYENKGNPCLPQTLTVVGLCGDYLCQRQFHYAASIQDEDQNAKNYNL